MTEAITRSPEGYIEKTVRLMPDAVAFIAEVGGGRDPQTFVADGIRRQIQFSSLHDEGYRMLAEFGGGDNPDARYFEIPV